MLLFLDKYSVITKDENLVYNKYKILWQGCDILQWRNKVLKNGSIISATKFSDLKSPFFQRFGIGGKSGFFVNELLVKMCVYWLIFSSFTSYTISIENRSNSEFIRAINSSMNDGFLLFLFLRFENLRFFRIS